MDGSSTITRGDKLAVAAAPGPRAPSGGDGKLYFVADKDLDYARCHKIRSMVIIIWPKGWGCSRITSSE